MVVREVDDRTVVAMALIENIQREDLNPLEEAQALQRLIDEFDLTHAAAAEAVGRSRTAVTNLLRLLELPAELRAMVESGALEMGHARVAGAGAGRGGRARRAGGRAGLVGARGRAPGATARRGPRAGQGRIAGRDQASPSADIASLQRELAKRWARAWTCSPDAADAASW